MQFFLLNESATRSKTSKIVIGLALTFAASLYAIYKMSDLEQEDDQNHGSMSQIKKPAGIYNEGNTCFVNSLLQALASVNSFQHNLNMAINNIRGSKDCNQELIVELASVMKKINSDSENIQVAHLLQLISDVKQDLINLQQQDAHQLYAAIVGSLENTLNRQKNIDLSASAKLQEEDIVENNLIGFTKSSITCIACQNQTAIKIHPFYDLSLQIRSPLVIDIKSAIREFERQERIQNWTCTNCTIAKHIKKLTNGIKYLKGRNKQKLTFIGKAIIQYLQSQEGHLECDISEINQSLSNFVLNYEVEYNNMWQDTERDIIFVQLQGVQTTIMKKTVITKFPKILVIHLKQLVINPMTGDVQLLRKYINFDKNLDIKIKNGNKCYNLTSLLTHIGNESMGHYFTFRRLNRESDKWYVISDSSSKRCQWEYVKKHRAYMLFYQSE